MRRLRRLTADSTAKRFLSAAHTATSPVTSGGAFSVCSALCTVWLRVLLGMIALRRYYNAFGTFCQYFFYRGAFFGKAQHYDIGIHPAIFCSMLFSVCRSFCSRLVGATEITRLRRRLSVFLSPEKEKLEKKELQGGCPLDPRLWWRHHNRMGKQRGGVSTGRTTRTGQNADC